MRVTYLTWGETPRASGVYKSQAIDQFVANADYHEEDGYYFISAIPIINSGMMKEKWSYPKQINCIRKLLGRIAFHIIPIFAPQNFVYSTKNTFGFMHGLSHLYLRRLLGKIQPNIVHCRSYHAAWAAIKVRERYAIQYSVVFDARGLFPEETYLKNKNRKGYEFWKAIEQEILCKSDEIIAVSETMTRHFQKIVMRDVRTIYVSSYIKKNDQGRIMKRNDEPLRFCYIGSLTEDGWHKISMLRDLFASLKKVYPKSRLTIVTKSDHKKIEKAFFNFLGKDLKITSADSVVTIEKYLKESDIGLMSYFIPENETQHILANTVIGVKTAEYLSAGLPIIVNKYCGGVAHILEDYGVGFSYDPNCINEERFKQIISMIKFDDKRTDKFNQAVDLFDLSLNAKKYFHVYKSCSVQVNSSK